MIGAVLGGGGRDGGDGEFDGELCREVCAFMHHVVVEAADLSSMSHAALLVFVSELLQIHEIILILVNLDGDDFLMHSQELMHRRICLGSLAWNGGCGSGMHVGGYVDARSWGGDDIQGSSVYDISIG